MTAFITRNRLIAILCIVTALAFTGPDINSQYSFGQQKGKADTTELSALLKKGSIGELTWWGAIPVSDHIRKWSSSHLEATGKPPAGPVTAEGQDEDEAEHEYYRKLERWSCMYSSLSAMDGDTSTAWCEGKKDEGVGEILVVKVDTTKPVWIWSGLGASDHLYKANNRARKIRIWALQARGARKEIGQYETGLVFEDISVVGSHEITLKDLNGWQPLPLPPRRGLAFRSVIENGKPAVEHKDSTFLAVEILSVYRGTRYNDTCISEIGIEKGK